MLSFCIVFIIIVVILENLYITG